MAIKGALNQQHMTMLNIYELNDRASKYMKPKLKVLQRVRDKLIIIVGDF